MAAQKVTGGFKVKKKGGGLGKRIFKTEAAANKAQARGRKLFAQQGGPPATAGKTTPSNGNGKNKKMTLGKALDAWSGTGFFIHRGIIFNRAPNDPETLEFTKIAIQKALTGIDSRDGTFAINRLAKGYGGMLNRGLEKKVFRFFGWRPPRGKLENFGDIADNLTYFGSTLTRAAPFRGDNQEMHRQAYLAQFGVDLGAQDATAYQPGVMIFEKWIPYGAQKTARKILRGLNVKMPSFKALTG